MKHIPIYTLSGLALALASLLLLFPFEQPLFAGVLAMGGYLLAMKDFSKYTSWLQFLTQTVAAVAVGLALEFPFETIPWLLIMMVMTLLCTFGRIMFFRFFGYTNYTWFEPTMLIAALICHVVGNLEAHSSWMTWLLPAPALIFSAIIAWGIIKDKQQLFAATSKGYKVAIGASAPEFALPDQNGETIKLSDYRGDRHLLLIFVRGDWCPGCHMMLRTYEKERERFKQKNIYVLSIGPDPVGVNREMVERLGLDFKVLSDEGQRTAMRYGVQLDEYDNAFSEKYDEGIPLPASFLVDKSGVVRYVSRPDKVGEFLNPSMIFPIIEKLN